MSRRHRWYAVAVDHGDGNRTYYGPTQDEDTAQDLAAFLTAEVDPAEVIEFTEGNLDLFTRWRQWDEKQRRALVSKGQPA